MCCMRVVDGIHFPCKVKPGRVALPRCKRSSNANYSSRERRPHAVAREKLSTTYGSLKYLSNGTLFGVSVTSSAVVVQIITFEKRSDPDAIYNLRFYGTWEAKPKYDGVSKDPTQPSATRLPYYRRYDIPPDITVWTL